MSEETETRYSPSRMSSDTASDSKTISTASKIETSESKKSSAENASNDEAEDTASDSESISTASKSEASESGYRRDWLVRRPRSQRMPKKSSAENASSYEAEDTTSSSKRRAKSPDRWPDEMVLTEYLTPRGLIVGWHRKYPQLDEGLLIEARLDSVNDEIYFLPIAPKHDNSLKTEIDQLLKQIKDDGHEVHSRDVLFHDQLFPRYKYVELQREGSETREEVKEWLLKILKEFKAKEDENAGGITLFGRRLRDG